MVSSAERQTPLARYGETRKSATLTMALCLGLAWLLVQRAFWIQLACLLLKLHPRRRGRVNEPRGDKTNTGSCDSKAIAVCRCCGSLLAFCGPHARPLLHAVGLHAVCKRPGRGGAVWAGARKKEGAKPRFSVD
jgi:hypothetical protein